MTTLIDTAADGILSVDQIMATDAPNDESSADLIKTNPVVDNSPISPNGENRESSTNLRVSSRSIEFSRDGFLAYSCPRLSWRCAAHLLMHLRDRHGSHHLAVLRGYPQASQSPPVSSREQPHRWRQDARGDGTDCLSVDHGQAQVCLPDGDRGRSRSCLSSTDQAPPQGIMSLPGPGRMTSARMSSRWNRRWRKMTSTVVSLVGSPNTIYASVPSSSLPTLSPLHKS